MWWNRFYVFRVARTTVLNSWNPNHILTCHIEALTSLKPCRNISQVMNFGSGKLSVLKYYFYDFWNWNERNLTSRNSISRWGFCKRLEGKARSFCGKVGLHTGVAKVVQVKPLFCSPSPSPLAHLTLPSSSSLAPSRSLSSWWCPTRTDLHSKLCSFTFLVSVRKRKSEQAQSCSSTLVQLSLFWLISTTYNDRNQKFQTTTREEFFFRRNESVVKICSKIFFCSHIFYFRWISRNWWLRAFYSQRCNCHEAIHTDVSEARLCWYMVVYFHEAATALWTEREPVNFLARAFDLLPVSGHIQLNVEESYGTRRKSHLF